MAAKTPSVSAAPVNPEIDPVSQANADTATKTILTSGLGVVEDETIKKPELG